MYGATCPIAPDTILIWSFFIFAVSWFAAGTVNEESWESQVLKSPVPVLVDYWAPWCGPCRMIAPLVDEIADEYGDKVRVVSISSFHASTAMSGGRAVCGPAGHHMFRQQGAMEFYHF